MTSSDPSPAGATPDAAADPRLRGVQLRRTAKGSYTATNVRGGTLRIGSGSDDDFTPVELLLAAVVACSAIDVDFITGKRAEPTTFTATAAGHKVSGDQGNRLTDIALDFDVRFPDDAGGHKAEEVLRRSIKQSHDRLCTVGRTVELATPVTAALRGVQIAPDPS